MIAIHALDGTEVAVNENAVTLVAGPTRMISALHLCARCRSRSAGDGRGCGGVGSPAGSRSPLGKADVTRCIAGVGQGIHRSVRSGRR